MTNDKGALPAEKRLVIRHSSFGLLSAFWFRHSAFQLVGGDFHVKEDGEEAPAEGRPQARPVVFEGWTGVGIPFRLVPWLSRRLSRSADSRNAAAMEEAGIDAAVGPVFGENGAEGGRGIGRMGAASSDTP